MDEREDLPSASAVARINDCPGSLAASRGMPDVVTPEMKIYAASGDRVHLWLEAPTIVDLSPWPKEQETAQRCQKSMQGVEIQVLGRPAKESELMLEKRMWLHSFDGRKRFSGRSDRVILSEDIGIVADYKSGWGDTPTPDVNLQLRSNLVLLFLYTKRGLKKGFTTIIQPNIGEPEVCEYSYEDMLAGEKELDQILARAEAPNAPLNPGESQCKFCPAAVKCPAAREVLQAVADKDLRLLVGISGEDLAKLLEIVAAAKPIIKKVEALAKAALKENASAVPGWSLEANAPTRSITSVKGVYEALYAAKLVNEKQFIDECASVGVGDLQAAMKKIHGMTEKEAKETVNNVCSEFIALKPKEPSLEKIKQK